MKGIDDPSHLREQYKSSSNLLSRASLHSRFSTNPENWFEWLFNRFNFPENAKVLEVGCGPGEMWKANRHRLSDRWRITLTDLSPGMVEAARKNVSHLPAIVDCRVADLQKLPFADYEFDVVIANHMLYHVPDKEVALREVTRILKRSGSFYAATNGINHMKELPELMAAFTGTPNHKVTEDLSFTTGNGAAFLSGFFSRVQLDRYPDELKITEVEPLVDYLFSSDRLCHPIRDARAEFREFLARLLKESGAIRIQKEVGMFTAMGPRKEI